MPDERLTLGICGSGTMGAGLAEVAARAGMSVIVRGRSDDSNAKLVATLSASMARQVSRQKLAQDDMDAAISRVRTTTALGQLEQCDLVIESIVEDLDAKLGLVAELGAVLRPGAIIATNTSTLSVEALAQRSGRPDRTVGIHFFNPATTMPLVEVVRAASTSDETVATAESFARQCGKEPVHVLDRPGFIVNALLFPYLNSAVKMLEAGTASMPDIDAAMKGGCNHPMGPFELLDLVGLDVAVSILDALHRGFGDLALAPAETLRALVSEGKLGRKTKQGFYSY
jgi:3-hydroxybutyryl-CoA dehydrogenase